MKTFLTMFIAGILLVSVNTANIVNANVEGQYANAKLRTILAGLQETVTQCSIDIGNSVDASTALVQAMGDDIDPTDKADLVEVKTSVNASKSALDSSLALIIEKWAHLE